MIALLLMFRRHPKGIPGKVKMICTALFHSSNIFPAHSTRYKLYS